MTSKMLLDVIGALLDLDLKEHLQKQTPSEWKAERGQNI